MRRALQVKTATLLGIVSCVLTMLLLSSLPAYAQDVTFPNSPRNCDNNAVINCGALTIAELQQKYAASTSAQDIFSFFGITSQDIANLPNTAVAGTVTRSGNVIVNGQMVATNAVTAGLQNIPGSTPEMTSGVAFFERPPSVSFVSDNLDAFVVMNNGQFMFAILASCGNPVIATSVAPPAAPAVITPVPTPTAVVITPTAQPTPPPQPLPSTGAGSILTIFATTAIFGTISAHFFLKRRELSRTL